MEALWLLLAYLAAWFAVTLPLSLRYSDETGRVVVTPLMIMVRAPVRFKSFEKLRGRRSVALLLDAGIVVLAVLMLLFYYMMIRNILAQLATGVRQGVVMPIIPAVTVSVETFLYMLPGLWVAILLHEAFHALAARHESIDIKSSGFMVLLGLIPAAFVEPDDEQLERAPTRAKLRVVSAGVLANTIVFLATLALLAGASHTGYYIVIAPVNGGFAAKTLPGPILVKEIIVNKTHVFTSIQDFIEYMQNLRKEHGGSLAHVALEVEFVTPKGRVYRVYKPAAPPGEANTKRYEKIGIYLYPLPRAFAAAGSPSTALALYQVTLYTEIINIGLAGINAAPLFISDGAQYIKFLAERKLGKKEATTMANLVSAITLALILPNLAI